MKSIFVILFALLSIGSLAQSKPSAGGNCFKDWYFLFRERGANPVADGTHDVVITIRNGDQSDCYMGRIDVVDGKLAGKLMVQKVDGTYEEWDKKLSDAYKDGEGRLREDLRVITNGMSASVTLSDGELVRLFFYKSLADKPKSNKKAPAPSVLVK